MTSEKEYRAIKMNSSSSLKEFATNRKKYYKRYVLGEEVEDEETKALTMGRVVETKLIEPELFDERFFPSVCESVPTGMMLGFVEALYKHTKAATNKEGEVTRNFDEIIEDAYKDSEYKISLDRVVKSFFGSDAEVYYQEIREVRSKGLTVISLQDAANADKIVEQLQNDPFIGPIVNLVRSARYDIYNQLQIEGVEVNGLQLKGMLDKVIVDHTDKIIQVYDLKCSWAVENFYTEYYLYRRGDIQAGVYHALANAHFAELIEEGYVVKPPMFIVCDSTAYFAPLVYVLSEEDITDAFTGFTYKDRQYKGINDIIDDLKWAIDNDVWNISRDNYQSGGHVKLKK